MRRMKNMKTKEQKNAVKKHENTPNQSPQKRGAQCSFLLSFFDKVGVRKP